MLNDPLFRPMLPDLFLSDFLDLVPNPFLLRGPTVFIESSGPAPFFALKATVSLAAIAVAAFYWYQERAAIAKQLRPLLPAGLGSGDSAVQASGVADSTYEELRSLSVCLSLCRKGACIYVCLDILLMHTCIHMRIQSGHGERGSGSVGVKLQDPPSALSDSGRVVR